METYYVSCHSERNDIFDITHVKLYIRPLFGFAKKGFSVNFDTSIRKA